MPENKDDTTVSDTSQLSLFQIVEGPGVRERYSNTIELYDVLPKYNWTQKREMSDLRDAEMIRHCTVHGQKYKIIIKPAIIKKRGKQVLIYPGTREEVVEDALRKLAVSGQANMIEGKVGVTFSLYQLQQELTSMGHGFSIVEIKEAIAVCAGANLEIYGDDDDTLLRSPFFPMTALTTRGDWAKNGTNARCHVMFNPLVTNSIINLTFRQYNYQLGMELNSALARFMYKRMSHYWVQASVSEPYTPSLISFLNQSPRGVSDRMSENIRAMKNALELLIKKEVVSHYEANQVRNGRHITDVRYVIFPHDKFIKMAISSNVQRNNMLEVMPQLRSNRRSS